MRSFELRSLQATKVGLRYVCFQVAYPLVQKGRAHPLTWAEMGWGKGYLDLRSLLPEWRGGTTHQSGQTQGRNRSDSEGLAAVTTLARMSSSVWQWLGAGAHTK